MREDICYLIFSAGLFLDHGSTCSDISFDHRARSVAIAVDQKRTKAHNQTCSRFRVNCLTKYSCWWHIKRPLTENALRQTQAPKAIVMDPPTVNTYAGLSRELFCQYVWVSRTTRLRNWHVSTSIPSIENEDATGALKTVALRALLEEVAASSPNYWNYPVHLRNWPPMNTKYIRFKFWLICLLTFDITTSKRSTSKLWLRLASSIKKRPKKHSAIVMRSSHNLLSWVKMCWEG